MAKPYYIYKRKNGIFYAEIIGSDGSIITRRSTGTTNKREAEKLIMSWIVNGNLPSRINSKTSETTTIEKLNIINKLKTVSFTFDDINNIVTILKERKYLQSATLYDTPSAQLLCDYLVSFWDYVSSPYVREKQLKGQSIHRDYCDAHIGKIKHYWYPIIKDKTVGDLTRKDINLIFSSVSIKHLSPKIWHISCRIT